MSFCSQDNAYFIDTINSILIKCTISDVFSDWVTIGDFLPSTSDADLLNTSAIQYIMEFLVKEFPSLHDLECFVPSRQCLHPVKKPTIVPMKVLFKDEKYKAETIEIIRQLIEDGKLTGNAQVNVYCVIIQLLHYIHVLYR